MGETSDLSDLAPPWRTHGFAVMRPVVVSASRVSLPPELEVVQHLGRSAGVLAYVEYHAPSPLVYSELAFLPCMVRPKGKRGPTGYYVAAMYVDCERSLAAGRKFWGLPKRLAHFERNGGNVSVRADDGLRVDLRFRVAPVGRAARSRMTTLQVVEGGIVLFRGRFDAKVAPSTCSVQRFTAGSEGWESFRGATRVPRPAVAMTHFESEMALASEHENSQISRGAAQSAGDVLER